MLPRSAVIGLPLLLLLAGAAPPKPAQVSSHEKAARELYRTIGGENLARQNAAAMMAILAGSEMVPYREVYSAWYEKLFTGADLEEEMVQLFMDTFSEKELGEILAFYKTPAGRKTIAIMPDLMARAAEIGMKQAAQHTDELEEMLDRAQEEHEKEPAATDEEAQKRTVAALRNTGTAMFSWLTDQVGAAAAGASQVEATHIVELKHYPQVSREQLEKILVPQYMQKVPETDGWGNPIEFYLNTANPLAPQVMGIRSPGRDGRFSAGSYTVGPFDPDDFDEDVVWADGFFVRWPQKAEP